MSILTNCKSIIAAVLSLAALVTAAFAVDKHFAHSDALIKLTLNFEQYKVDQRLDTIQDKIWQTEDRIAEEGNKPELVKRLRELKAEQKKLQDRSDKMETK